MRNRIKTGLAIILIGALGQRAVPTASAASDAKASYNAGTVTFTNSLPANTTNSAQVGLIDARAQQDVQLAFRGSLAGAGDGAILIAGKQAVDPSIYETTSSFTWIIDTSGWTKGSTNVVITNIVIKGAALTLDTLGNGNTSVVSAVRITRGFKNRIHGNELN